MTKTRVCREQDKTLRDGRQVSTIDSIKHVRSIRDVTHSHCEALYGGSWCRHFGSTASAVYRLM